MHRLVRSWWGRQLKLVLGFHLFFIGCGDERRHFFILNDVVLTVDRAPVATIQEAPAAQLARFDATAQAADIVITQMTVQTSHPTYGAFITTNDGVVGKSIQVDPFTVNDPAQFQFSVRQSLLNIQPTNGRNALLRLDQIGQVEQMSLFFNTLGLDDEVVNFRVLSITASSASSPPKEIPLPGLNFTLLVTAPPLVLAEAIQPVRVHVARGASEVLAEVVLTELSNEHSVVLQLMEARFDKALIGLNPRLVDSFGNILGFGILDPDDPRTVFFDLSTGGALSIAPGQAKRVFVAGDMTLFPSIDTLTLEIPTFIFENDNGETDSIDGPVDPATRNLVQFVNVF